MPVPHRNRRLLKWIALWSAMPWPHGRPTNPMHDPRAEGTRPSVFAEDLARLLAGLDTLAAATEGSLEPAHGLFGHNDDARLAALGVSPHGLSPETVCSKLDPSCNRGW